MGVVAPHCVGLRLEDHIGMTVKEVSRRRGGRRAMGARASALVLDISPRRLPGAGFPARSAPLAPCARFAGRWKWRAREDSNSQPPDP